MIRINYHVTETQLARLRDESKASGLTVAELIRRYIDAGLEKTRRKEDKGCKAAST